MSLLATLLGRLWFLQVHEGAVRAGRQPNRVREVVTPAPRGEVYDATGAPLVRNRTALVVSVDRARLLRLPDDGEAVLQRLGRVVGKTPAALRHEITPCGGDVVAPCWRGSPYQPVPVKEYAADDAAGLRRVLAVEEHREDFPAVDTRFAAVREYPRAAGRPRPGLPRADQPGGDGTLPQYAGVQDDALVGRAGVEASYDAALRGRDGVQQLLVDHVGAVTGRGGGDAARPGDKLVLSLHAGVQAVAEQALARAVAAARTRPTGAATARTGPTPARSWSWRPGPAGWSRWPATRATTRRCSSAGRATRSTRSSSTSARGAPLVFRAIQGAYAPASTFKVVSTVAAVEDGSPLDGVYPCPGAYAPLGGKRNFEGVGLGPITLRTAIVKSCDTIYYDLAYEQWLRDGGNDPVARPKDPMVRMAQGFGLGSPHRRRPAQRAHRHDRRPRLPAAAVGAAA